MIRGPAFLPMLLSIVLAAGAGAENFNANRYWRYRGKILESVSLVSWSADKTKVTLENPGGKMVEVALKDLSNEDQAFVARAIDDAERKASGAPPILETDPVFKQFPAADRTSVPVIDQGKYGQKASDCVPSSFCNFLLWWDQQNVLAIPKRGDFDDKAEWIHTQMARHCRTRNTSGTLYTEAMEGFAKYFDKETAEITAHLMKLDYDISPANLARYTTGYNATMLCMTTQRGTDKSGHMVALVSAAANGDVVFHTWGHRMKGKINVLKQTDKPVGYYGVNGMGANGTTYEIKVEHDDKFEDWVKETRFILDPENMDAILIVKPYVFAEAGKKSKTPVDALMVR